MGILHDLMSYLLILFSWTYIDCLGQGVPEHSGNDLNHKPGIFIKMCQEPWTPDNVEFEPSPFSVGWNNRVSYWPGTQLRFYCTNRGQTLVGHNTIYCAKNGNWVPSNVPICYDKVAEHKTCPSPKINNGDWKCAKENCEKSLLSGTQIQIVCEKGATLHGASLVKCAQGRWSPELPTCVKPNDRCPSLKPVENGSFHCITERCLEFGVRAMLDVVCDSGFGLTGTPTLSCRIDGTWSSDPPMCIPLQGKSCPMPYKIQHGQWEVGNYAVKYPPFGVGASVVYRCDSGYRLVGGSKLTCNEHGRWSSFPPTCNAQVLCPDPGPIDNGRFECADLSTACTDYSVGTRLVFVCDEGYQRHGESQIECLNKGQWSSVKPSCSKLSSTSAPVTSGTFGNTTTVVIATACSVLGVLMVVMLVVVAIQRRRPPSQLVHQIQAPPPAYSQTYTPPIPSPDPEHNHDRLALIAYDGVSLPSYEEVVSSSRNRPRVHRQADSASRQSVVTNSTANRDAISAFGSLDTVNQSTANLSTVASTDNTSTSVTVETYDSGASVPSIAMTSRRAVAGSLASTSDTSSVHKEESPLLEPEPEFPSSSQDVEMEDLKVD